MLALKMRFRFAVAGGSVFVILLASAGRQVPGGAGQVYSSSPEIEAKRSSQEFRPDGDLSKPSWKRAQWMEFDNDAPGKSHHPEVATRVASVWTDTHIYFAFSSHYDSLNIYEGEDPKVERWQLWD